MTAQSWLYRCEDNVWRKNLICRAKNYSCWIRNNWKGQRGSTIRFSCLSRRRARYRSGGDLYSDYLRNASFACSFHQFPRDVSSYDSSTLTRINDRRAGGGVAVSKACLKPAALSALFKRLARAWISREERKTARARSPFFPPGIRQWWVI